MSEKFWDNYKNVKKRNLSPFKILAYPEKNKGPLDEYLKPNLKKRQKILANNS